MSKGNNTDNNKSVVLPFKGKTKNKLKNAAMLVAIDMPNNSENLPEELLTKFIEEKFQAAVLHVEYIDIEFPYEKESFAINSVNDNRPKIK